MLARKILMHIAVERGADPGKSFAYYVSYLVDNNYVPPDSRDWVDEIRENGHEANHEIREVTIEQARSVLDFVTMLLELLYEFPDEAAALSSPARRLRIRRIRPVRCNRAFGMAMSASGASLPSNRKLLSTQACDRRPVMRSTPSAATLSAAAPDKVGQHAPLA